MSNYDLTYLIYGQTPQAPQAVPTPFSSGSKLTIRDEGVFLTSQVSEINFVGGDVQAIETGNKQVKIVVGLTATNQNVIQKLNTTGLILPALKTVSEKSDGSIELMTLTTADGEDFYGVTLEAISPGQYGPVQIGGIVENALLGRGWAVESKIFGTDAPGEFTNVPTTLPGRKVVQLGFASGPTGKDFKIQKRFIIRNT